MLSTYGNTFQHHGNEWSVLSRLWGRYKLIIPSTNYWVLSQWFYTVFQGQVSFIALIRVSAHWPKRISSLVNSPPPRPLTWPRLSFQYPKDPTPLPCTVWHDYPRASPDTVHPLSLSIHWEQMGMNGHYPKQTRRVGLGLISCSEQERAGHMRSPGLTAKRAQGPQGRGSFPQADRRSLFPSI